MESKGDKLNNLKDIRWRERFEHFEKSYKLLEKYINQENKTELENAGLIQFFKMTFELSWKLLKDYLESIGFEVKSPRETIKKAFQIELIDDGHIWMDALLNKNITIHTYYEELAEEIVKDIKERYFGQFKKLYQKLKKDY